MTATEPGKRLLNQLNKLQQAATSLLTQLEDYPDLKSSKPARDLKKLLGSPTLAKAKKARKQYTTQPAETFQPGISHPQPGVMVHRVK